MKLMNIMFVFVFALTAYATKNAKRLCGKQIPDALTLACRQRYHSHQHRITKRDIKHFNFNEVRSRLRRGIVKECCTNTCSFRKLMSYCENGYDINEAAGDEYSKKGGSYLPSNALPRDNSYKQDYEEWKETTTQSVRTINGASKLNRRKYKHYKKKGMPLSVWDKEIHDKYRINHLNRHNFDYST